MEKIRFNKKKIAVFIIDSLHEPLGYRTHDAIGEYKI